VHASQAHGARALHFAEATIEATGDNTAE